MAAAAAHLFLQPLQDLALRQPLPRRLGRDGPEQQAHQAVHLAPALGEGFHSAEAGAAFVAPLGRPVERRSQERRVLQSLPAR